jgi:hypothetical protein
MKWLSTIFFIFLLLFATHSFGKTNEYYRTTLTHILTKCNSDCQRQVFEKEINEAIFSLFDAVLRQLQFELSQKKKEKLWQKDFF